MKKCAECNQEKSLSEFRNYKRSPDGKEYACKQCRRAAGRKYYAENPKVRGRKEQRRERFRKFIWEYLEQHPCIDCGETDPIVLEFDHAGDKQYNISHMHDHAISTVKKEIAKCDVRCANCHKRKTHKTLGYWTP